MTLMHNEWDIRKEIENLEILLKRTNKKTRISEILRTIEFAKWVLGDEFNLGEYTERLRNRELV